MNRLSILIFFFLMLPCVTMPALYAQEVRTPSISFNPETYVVYKTQQPLTIDGDLSKIEWEQAEWTSAFVDIRGDEYPSPRYETRAKMLWDDDYFYFAAKLEEPHVWATITERDAVIYMDNNFEIFIDPNGDTHNYYELEVNALGTFWDLMLTKPYRNGGRAINAWDIKGLKIGIDIQGTLNNPTDIDEGWTVEIAIPWSVLLEATRGGMPVEGTQWRVGFSRVQWQTEVIDGEYVKLKDPDTGRDLPEDNWVWSPQGLINMHFPEMWGLVQFSEKAAGEADVQFNWNPAEDYKWLLRELYYRQTEYRNRHGRYSENGADLGFDESFDKLFDEDTPLPKFTISVLDDTYIMRLQPEDMNYNFYIRNDSKVWKTER
ncbi:MAG: carbohydrate-binding family 9-like protein [Balneolaceae bacterium]|nr:MAG: carbohydrate-binding family 9-like protein [Balneolaceae bacterium]